MPNPDFDAISKRPSPLKRALLWFAKYSILAVIIFLLWNTTVLKYFKILVVFLHETSHAFAAILTGGHVRNIAVSSTESGVTFVSGGLSAIMYSAGYLGTSLIGALLIASGNSRKLKRYVLLVLGIILILSTALFVRNLFGILYGTIAGTIFIFLYIRDFFFSVYVTDFVGMMCVVYSIYDFLDFLGPGENDATLLAKLSGLPSPLIYGTWITIALVLFIWAFRKSFRSAVRTTGRNSETG